MMRSFAFALLIHEASGALRAHATSSAPDLTSFELSCYVEKDPSGEDGGAKGRSYRGLSTSTASGRTCQKWTSNHPWKDALAIKPTPDDKEKIDDETEITHWGNGLGNHNYCRNPDSSEEKPWCYTMDTVEDHKKELCEIPKCPAKKRDFVSEAGDLSVEVATGLDCDCAGQLYGSTETTADTSVSLAQDGRRPHRSHRHCDCSKHHR